MEKKTTKWRSPSLGKDMNMAIYGKSGTPMIGLPTRGKPCTQWEEKGMVNALSFQIENEFNQLFCVESLDLQSMLNKQIKPINRIARLQQYESYISEEVVPFVRKQSMSDFLMIAGVDTGGYHALNMGLKYPGMFDKVIGISGLYDIKPLMDGFYNDDVYFSNPMDYLPNMNHSGLLEKIRSTDFRLVTYANDIHRSDAHRMSDVMRMKFIDHRLDEWDMHSKEQWDLWTKMIKTHIV